MKTCIGFTLLGLVFAVVSGYLIFFAEKDVFATVQAQIVSIEETYDTTLEEYTHRVYVDYTVDGKPYTGVELGAYSSSMKTGDTIEIEYDVQDPMHIQSIGSEKIPYVIFAVGLLCFGVGLFFTIKNIKKPTEDFEEYNRVASRKFDEQTVEEIRTSTEPTNRYFFHPDRKLKQGYQLEDENHRMIYEAKMTNLTLVKAYEYEFINHLTGISKTVKIGHTVSSGVGAGFGFQVPISNSFIVDGVKNWDHIADNGFGFAYERKGIKPCFRVNHCGVEVAYIETTGADVFGEKETKNPLYKLPVNGCFRVDCRDSDLDMIFLICLSIARAVFYENT